MNKRGSRVKENKVMNKKANKKGILLKQVIEIILAITIVVILIMVVPRLLATYFGRQEDLQAKGTLDLIVQKLNSLQEGETIGCLIYAPIGWHIVSFDSEHNKNNNYDKPTKYFGQNLLCVCKKNCNICQTIKKPLMLESKLANLVINVSNIWLSNLENFYTISYIAPLDDIELSEEEKLLSLTYKESSTAIDSWLREKNSPLAGQGQCIVDTAIKTKVPIEVILAIAIHESGWGKSGLAEECKNLFGMKGKGTQGSCEMPTNEFDKKTGKKIRLKQDFAKYDNFCESITHFCKIISTSSNYAEAMKYTNDPERMVYAIHGCSGPYAGKDCIYSTDPDWAKDVIALINQIKKANIVS